MIMKRLLISTAVVAVLMGSGVRAQTAATMPTITAPEGYARQYIALTVSFWGDNLLLCPNPETRAGWCAHLP